VVYNGQNYGGSGLCPSPRILKNRKQCLETASVLSSGDGRKIPTPLGPLERLRLALSFQIKMKRSCILDA
jgi:hypothetical protein